MRFFRTFEGKKISWACLKISVLILIDHWKAYFVALLISCTVENNEGSSATSFGLYWRPLDKSLT